MAGADTRPTEPLPQWAASTPPQRRRRGAWPWFVGFAIVALLAVAAWFAAEAIARQVVIGVVRDQVRTQLALPDAQPIDVGLVEPVLPQLIGGTLTELTVSSEDVVLGSVEGDMSVVARGVPVRGSDDIAGAEGTLVLDEEQLRVLLSGVQGFPADSLGLAAPNITATTDLTIFGATVAVGAALTPSASGGDLVLSPASLQLGGAEVSADELQDRFGRIADGVLRDWDVCVAEYLPAGVTLTSVAVAGETLVAGFDIDGGIANDPALQESGTCA